jgi:hypothetical protein
MSRGHCAKRKPSSISGTKSKCKTKQKNEMKTKNKLLRYGLSLLAGMGALLCSTSLAQAADKKPNIVMLMTDDTGWNDFGCYGGGANLGHPNPED